MRSTSLLRAVAAASALALLAAACNPDDGGGGKTAEGPSAFDAAAGAEEIRALGNVEITGTAERHGQDGTIQGRLGYGDEPAAAEHIPYFAGSKLVGLEYRRRGDDGWMRRVPAKGLTDLGLGPDLLAVRAEDAPPWVLAPPDQPGTIHVAGPYDPAAMLDAVAEAGTRFRRSADAAVGGADRPGYSAKLPAQQARALGIVRVTVWTNQAGRPLRIRLVTPSGTRSTYDLTRSKRKVEVEPPPDSSIEKAGQTPAPSATGPYVEVTTGTAGTATYRVLRAPASDGGTCWKVEATPPYVPFAEAGADGGYCIPPLGDPTGDWDLLGFPIDADAQTPYEMIGFLAPAGSTGEMLMDDGTRRPMTVDASGLAIYGGPSSPVAGLAIVTLPDGRALYCAPGLIVTPNDLEELGPGGGASLRGEPWNCLFEADV